MPAPDPELIEEARALHDTGITQRAVAERMGKSAATISRWLSLPDDPDPGVALEVGAHRADVRKRAIDRGYAVIFKLFDEVERDVKKHKYTPKHPPAVVLGIMVDKVVALEMAEKNMPDLPKGSAVNIFADIAQIAPVVERVANAGRPVAIDGDVRPDDTPEPVHPEGPQAAPEAGRVLTCVRPQDG